MQATHRFGPVGLVALAIGFGGCGSSAGNSVKTGGASAGGSAGAALSGRAGAATGGTINGSSGATGGTETSGGATMGDAGAVGRAGRPGGDSGGAMAGASGGKAAMGGGGKSNYVPPIGKGEPGEWTRISTPAPNAWSVLNDPVRPNDFYAFLNEDEGSQHFGTIHVVKSEDYGATWTPLSQREFDGAPWGAAIDPNPHRDPATPPVMYTPAGYGHAGLWKSTDGGTQWAQVFGEKDATPLGAVSRYWPPDLYAVHIIPDKPPDHIVVTFHANGWDGGDHGFGESMDGGRTWEVHQPLSGMGASHYMVIVDAETWLAVSEDTGIFKTSTAGRVNGRPSPSAWKKVDDMPHYHGSMQAQIVNGVIYIPGNGGIKRSTDKGDTWEYVYQSDWMSGVVATGRFLYADYMLGPNLLRSPINDGENWTKYCETPSQLDNGSNDYGLAAATDGQRWYIVSGNFTAGLWRYVEE